MNRITFMISVPDQIRADVAMTEDKTYYRFATDDSIEDGELPGLKKEFDKFTEHLLESFTPGIGITTDISPVKFTLFVNNVVVRPAVLNRDTLRAFISKLADKYNEFTFLLPVTR